jgi:hypothetical protein
MFHNEMNRLQHFLQNDPKSMDEVTEAIKLTTARAGEIAQACATQEPTEQQLGELDMLRQLIEHVFQVGEFLVAYKVAQNYEEQLREERGAAFVGSTYVLQ